jgi:hypothetical protein
MLDKHHWQLRHDLLIIYYFNHQRRYDMIGKINYQSLALLVSIFLMMAIYAPDAKAMDLLETGARGEQVREVQSYLYQLGYLKVKPTGYYGKLTKAAVIAFQIEHNLAVDGIVGVMTMSTLREMTGDSNRIVDFNHISRRRPGGIQAVSWTIVNQLWRNGEIARIIDVETGKSFQAKRLYGYYHADVEPLTKEDTGIMKEIYGGKWSWKRRAVVVQVRKLFIAASINGMPHGGQSIVDNDFNGQFCAHFLGSRVHQTGRVDPDHQAMIEQAHKTSLFDGVYHQPEFVPVLTEMERENINHPKF